MSKKKNIGQALDLEILKRIFSYVKPYRKNFGFAVFTTVTLALISPLRPYLIQYTFDNYVTESNTGMLLNMTLILVALLMLEAVMQFADSFLTNRLGQYIIKDLRIQLYKHVIGRSVSIM